MSSDASSGGKFYSVELMSTSLRAVTCWNCLGLGGSYHLGLRNASASRSRSQKAIALGSLCLTSATLCGTDITGHWSLVTVFYAVLWLSYDCLMTVLWLSYDCLMSRAFQIWQEWLMYQWYINDYQCISCVGYGMTEFRDVTELQRVATMFRHAVGGMS